MAPVYNNVNSSAGHTIGANNNLSGAGTITCPAGSYAYGTTGRSGKSVDYIGGLNCRNIYTGATTTVTNGAFGGGGGGTSTKPVDCGSGGLTGFWTASNNNVNLDGYGGACRPTSGCGSGDCGDAWTWVGNDGSGGGNNLNIVGDTQHLVNTVSGAKSNNNVVANFSWNTLNFDTIAGYPNKYLQQGAACCAGQDNSAECSNAKGGGLNCSSTLQNYCSQGDRIYSDSICTGAMGNGTLDATWARNQQLHWCQQGSNFNTDNCKNFCTASTGGDSTQKEACNTLYSSQCSQAANKSLDICSCSLNWSDYPAAATAVIDKIAGAPQEPLCYFSQCQQKGYLKTSKDKLACPACIQSQNIDITNATANLQNISQSCNVSTSTATSAAATTTAASSTPSGGTTSSTATSASVTPVAAVSTPTTTTATTTAATTASSSSKTPLLFAAGGVAGFCLLAAVAIAVTKR